MSAVVKTLTPFTEQDVLVNALESLGVEVTCNGKRILTNRKDYQGYQKFEWTGDAYRFSYDSDELRGQIVSRAIDRGYTPVSQFLRVLETAYKKAYQEKLERLEEEERQRLEKERLARIEVVRQKSIEKAKAKGYQVKENRKNGKIQLVLTRTVF